MEKKGNQQQVQGLWRKAMSMIRSMLAFLSTKQHDGNIVAITERPANPDTITKRPANPDNGPVPILAVDVDKETEKFIMRVRSNMKNSFVEDQPTINGSNGSLGSPD